MQSRELKYKWKNLILETIGNRKEDVMKKSIGVVLVVFICFWLGQTESKAMTDQDYRPQLTKKKMTIEVGERVNLDANCFVVDNKGNWKSSNTKIATINKWNGQVIAKKKGKTTITLKEDGKTYTCKLTVIAKKKKKSSEVKALKKLIKKVNKKGGKWPTSIDSKSYQWHGGHLIGIDTSETKGKVKTKISLSPFTYLQNVSINNIKSIDVKKCKKLERLMCYEIEKAVNVSNCKKLKKLTLEVTGKKKEEINLSKNKKLIACDIDGECISSVNLKNCGQLEFLSLSQCEVSKLDLSTCKNLKFLDCGMLKKLSAIEMEECKKIVEFTISAKGKVNSRTKKMSLHFKDLPDLERLSVQAFYVSEVVVENCDSIAMLAMRKEYLERFVMENCQCSQNVSTLIEVKSVRIVNCANLDNLWITGANDIQIASCPSLRNLTCMEGSLTSLDTIDCPGLTSISCRDNKITEIDITKFPNLRMLGCTGNPIKSIDVTTNPNLILYCDEGVNVIGKTTTP